MKYKTTYEPINEAEIIKNWNPLRGNLVSVCMLSYNHAPYIRDALNSVLNQKTDFGFEILIHDDASLDNSQEIIREYAERYPKIVKPIYQSVNQHSQRIFPTLNFNYPRANLPFVAICECDDFWIDENKLQLQIDGLLENPEINLSFHAAFMFNSTKPEQALVFHGDYETTNAIVPFTNVVLRTRGWIPTASCVIRQSAKKTLMEFLKSKDYLTVGDLYLQFFSALPNGALFFSKPMSMYRFRTEHSWSKKVSKDVDFKGKHELAMIRSYVELNQMTNRHYQDIFTILIFQRLLWLFSPAPPKSQLTNIDFFKKLHTSCQKNISLLLEALISGQKRYIIYGCASGCFKVLNNIPNNQILAIVDRDERKTGDEIHGIPIIANNDLHNYSNHDIIVSTLVINQNKLQEIFNDAGIPKNKVHYLFAGALNIVSENLKHLEAMYNQ